MAMNRITYNDFLNVGKIDIELSEKYFEFIPDNWKKPRRHPFYSTKFKEFDTYVDENHSPPNGAYKEKLCLEMGVWKGTSLNYLSSKWKNQTWWGFDTFKGINDSFAFEWKYSRDMKSFQTEIPSLNDNCNLVVGEIESTINDWCLEHKDGYITFLNLDLDVYRSTLYSLIKLNDFFVPGSIIRFDEMFDWRYLGFESSDINVFFPRQQTYTSAPAPYEALLDWVNITGRKIKPLWRNCFHSVGIQILR